MNLILTVLEVVAPVFLLGMVGFVWARMGVDYPIAFVTRLAMTLGVPALIFTALVDTRIDPGALRDLALATLAAYGAVGAVFALGLRLSGRSLRVYLSPLTFGNTGNIGLPIALFAFGAEGLGYAVVVLGIMTVLYFTFGLWVTAGKGNVRRVLTEPMLWATLAGLVCLWQGWRPPDVAMNALGLLGQIAIPLMLITLGVSVTRLSSRHMAEAQVLSLAKAALSVAAAWGVGRWIGLDPVPFAILVLQVATPVAVTSYLIAEKYAAGPDRVAGLVVVSTLQSVILFPILLAFVI